MAKISSIDGASRSL